MPKPKPSSDPPQPLITRSQATLLGAAALRNLARPLAFDANRWNKLGARDQAAYTAYTERTRALLAAQILASLADELATAERAELLKRSRVPVATHGNPAVSTRSTDRDKTNNRDRREGDLKPPPGRRPAPTRRLASQKPAQRSTDPANQGDNQ